MSSSFSVPDEDAQSSRVAALLTALDGDVSTAVAATLRGLDGHAIPSPQRELLVHSDGLTPTLERHLGEPLRLRTLRMRRDGDTLTRHILLITTDDGRAVSFGAIRLHLERFAPHVRAEIVAGETPLGAIVRAHRVAHQRRLLGFFEVAAETLAATGLVVGREPVLYGRHSEIATPAGQLMAEVVEILAPAGGGRARD